MMNLKEVGTLLSEIWLDFYLLLNLFLINGGAWLDFRQIELVAEKRKWMLANEFIRCQFMHFPFD